MATLRSCSLVFATATSHSHPRICLLATFSCALCPSQPCPSTTEPSPYPTTLPSCWQPRAHIHDPFFITWVGPKGAINNFIKATRLYVWMDRNKVGVQSKGRVEVVIST